MENLPQHNSVYDKSPKVRGTDGGLYPSVIYSDKLGQDIPSMTTAEKKDRERRYREQQENIRNFRKVLGTEKYGRIEPVTQRGKARKAAGFADWLKVDLEAEAEQKGVPVESLDGYKQDEAEARKQRIAQAAKAVKEMTHEEMLKIYQAMLDNGFRPEAG